MNDHDVNIAADALAERAQGMIDQNDTELRARLCSAEIQAVLEKYQMAVAISRIEKLQPGQGIHVEYNFNFVPAPRGNGKAANS